MHRRLVCNCLRVTLMDCRLLKRKLVLYRNCMYTYAQEEREITIFKKDTWKKEKKKKIRHWKVGTGSSSSCGELGGSSCIITRAKRHDNKSRDSIRLLLFSSLLFSCGCAPKPPSESESLPCLVLLLIDYAPPFFFFFAFFPRPSYFPYFS